MSNLITKIDKVLTEEKQEYVAAVAVVNHRDKWLLGLAKNTGDDRNNKWVCPGGGIKGDEDPRDAAVREAKEETGVDCRATSGVLKDRNNRKKRVAFVACKASSSRHRDLKPNHEFAALGWFTPSEMKSLDLYYNVQDLVRRAKRHV
jgi:8-oxo-dGTP pyrophosphatase MutT (NUDIX family)